VGDVNVDRIFSFIEMIHDVHSIAFMLDLRQMVGASDVHGPPRVDDFTVHCSPPVLELRTIFSLNDLLSNVKVLRKFDLNNEIC